MTAIDEARARLATLHMDTTTERDRELRRITQAERDSILMIFDEIHRLHCAIRDTTQLNRAPEIPRTHRRKQ